MNSYIPPELVRSPKQRISNIPEVVFDGGESRDGEQSTFSLANLIWDNQRVLGIRWNGSANSPTGTPQSRGTATWFILPNELTRQASSWDFLDKHQKSLIFEFQDRNSN